MAYATPADLATYLGEEFDSSESTRADELLVEATGEIDHAAGQSFDEVIGDTVTLDGPGWYLLVLPAWPVTDITDVTEDGTTLTVDDDYQWSATGMVWRIGRSWSGQPRSIGVTFDHGYATIPPVVRSTCIQAAARAFTNPGGMSSESIGSYSYRVREANATGVKLTPVEREKMRSFTARTRGV